MGTIKLFIDDREIEAEEGSRLLDVALENGIEIPHFCYHPALKVHGSCRLCLVEIEGIPKLQPACNTAVKEGMKVSTTSERVVKTRALMLELFTNNHPMDCPVCDKSGECKLQDYVYEYGEKRDRFKEKKRTYTYQYIGDKIVRNMERCVMCTRCVRFVRDVVGIEEYGVFERGFHTTLGTYVPETLTSEHQGNLHDICPVGALTTRDFRFKKRVWYLDKTQSICPLCATGCNIEIHHHDNKIYRLVPVRNDDVNGFFMCDTGRFGFHRYEEEHRLLEPQFQGEAIDWNNALERFADYIFTAKQYAIIGGGNLTNEDLFVIKEFVDKTKATDEIAYKVSEQQQNNDYSKKDFLINNHRYPNSKGAEYIGFDKTSVNSIIDKAKSGAIDVVIVLEEDATQWDFGDAKVVVITSFKDRIGKAQLALPITGFAEADGSYTNVQGYVQFKQAAIVPKETVKHPFEIFVGVAQKLDKNIGQYNSYDDIVKAQKLPERIGQ